MDFDCHKRNGGDGFCSQHFLYGLNKMESSGPVVTLFNTMILLDATLIQSPAGEKIVPIMGSVTTQYHEKFGKMQISNGDSGLENHQIPWEVQPDVRGVMDCGQKSLCQCDSVISSCPSYQPMATCIECHISSICQIMLRVTMR